MVGLVTFLGGTTLDYSVSNTACDRHAAVTAFLDAVINKDIKPNAILGCRCSAPTMVTSMLAAAYNIPVVSPASSNPHLSNKGDYPTFSRLVAPDNSSGQVGALVALLRQFGWDRITIINTNSQYATDFKVELMEAWRGQQEGFTGEVGYEGTVQVDQDTDKVDLNSVENVLANVPVDDPKINSRIVVLLAHHHHAFPILKAAKHHLKSDTIYVGVSAWTGREPEDADTSWMPDVPGKARCFLRMYFVQQSHVDSY